MPVSFYSSRAARCAGLSRVEFLVLLVVVVALAGVAAGPVYDWVTNGKVTRGVEGAHTLSLLLSQYATDNGGVYPAGEGTNAPGKSAGIAQNLLAAHFLPDTRVFAVGSTKPYSGKSEDFSDLAAENVGWDFTTGASATTGLSSSAPDLLPVVFTTGQAIQYTPGASVTLSGRGPYAKDGMVVGEKGGSVRYLQGVNGTCTDFISTGFHSSETYTQVTP